MKKGSIAEDRPDGGGDAERRPPATCRACGLHSPLWVASAREPATDRARGEDDSGPGTQRAAPRTGSQGKRPPRSKGNNPGPLCTTCASLNAPTPTILDRTPRAAELGHWILVIGGTPKEGHWNASVSRQPLRSIASCSVTNLLSHAHGQSAASASWHTSRRPRAHARRPRLRLCERRNSASELKPGQLAAIRDPRVL